ncbi:hypothetical protein [Catellatospora sp. NPDC049133]|uniref:hypothetical protein n=1 Tax=Catellatospora sp. NPDC049133 TaxID=3155499 RepID=UPI003407C670
MNPTSIASPNASTLGPEVVYVADTGPLLCLGGSKKLRDVFKQRCYGKAHWVVAVREELLHQARGKDARARAAQAYTGKAAAWLPAAITFSDADESELVVIKERLEELAKEKEIRTGRAASTHQLAHLGETQSILHARRHKHTLLAHDNDARKVASEHGIPTATMIALAQRLVREGHSAKELANEFQALKLDNIDLGAPFMGPLDLTPRPNPPIPRQRPSNSSGT